MQRKIAYYQSYKILYIKYIRKWVSGDLHQLLFKLFFGEFVFEEQNVWTEKRSFLLSFSEEMYNNKAQGKVNSSEKGLCVFVAMGEVICVAGPLELCHQNKGHHAEGSIMSASRLPSSFQWELVFGSNDFQFTYKKTNGRHLIKF